VLSENESEVQLATLSDGPEALSDSIAEQTERLAAEQVRIVAHDSLDAIDDSTTNADRTADDRLIASDQRRELTAALATWLEGVATTLSWEGRDIVRIGRRPRPQVPLDLEIEIAHYTDIPLAVARQASVERCLPILRAGHPVVDAVASHLLRDDRGIAFAMFRPWPGMWPPRIVFRTDFLVSAAVDDRLSGQADAVDLRSWIEQAITDLLPPLVETVVITAEGREVTDPRLRRPYDQQRDRNLTSRPDVFQGLTATLDWKATCGAAAQRARDLVQQRPSIVDRPTRAAAQLKTMIARRADRSRARQIAGLLDSDVDLTSLYAAFPDQFPQWVDALGCGVIFVGDPEQLVTA
jgi:ATP-dependent helicase HepA